MIAQKWFSIATEIIEISIEFVDYKTAGKSKLFTLLVVFLAPKHVMSTKRHYAG